MSPFAEFHINAVLPDGRGIVVDVYRYRESDTHARNIEGCFVYWEENKERLTREEQDVEMIDQVGGKWTIYSYALECALTGSERIMKF